MIKNLIYPLAIWLMILSLASCGFHLRRQLPLPSDLDTIALLSDNPNGQLTQGLEQIFRSHQIGVVHDLQAAPIALRLFGETVHSNLLSESASFATKQYTLTYDVDYELLVDHKIVLEPQHLHAFCNYMVNEGQVLSASTEQQILSSDLQQDLLYQLMAQLSSPRIKHLIEQYSSKNP